MAKKSDILSIYFKNIDNFNADYQSRLMKIKRDFEIEKTSYETILTEIENDFTNNNSDKFNDYNYMELKHQTQIELIDNEYKDHFSEIEKRLDNNIDLLNSKIDEENKLFEDVLRQFDERKQEALNKYLELIHDNDLEVEESIAVHREFINQEDIKLEEKKDQLQDINSSLANDLLDIMENAKNSLNNLQDNLKEGNINDGKEFNQTILISLENLRGVQASIISLFKDNTNDLEQKRDHIKLTSKTKQKPHSQLNQKLIEQYVKQIREVNTNKVYFEAKVKADLDSSLTRVHQRILKADNEHNLNDLRKYISQKEIIEKKANYLLHRNQTLSSFTVRKYQQEIKKIKIDSFKRSEEIKLAYSIPVIFLQNSIDTYSNFAFYLNQSFDELDRLLSNFIDFNQEHLDLKSDFILNTSKAYEDYKINLLVRVNEVAANLSKLISRIDEVSFKVVTLESQNQVEIAEVRKKIENLEVLSDYQKYLTSLENDEFFAMYQHSKNIERIQLDFKEKESEILSDKKVIELQKSKNINQEYMQYMLNLNQTESKIHRMVIERLDKEYSIFYEKQNHLSYLIHKIAKLEIINDIKNENYYLAEKFHNIEALEKHQNKLSSNHVIEFVKDTQKLIDTNNQQKEIEFQCLEDSDNDYTYLTIVEKQRLNLIKRIDALEKRKSASAFEAVSIYYRETRDLIDEIFSQIDNRIKTFKELLLYNEVSSINYYSDIIHKSGYRESISEMLTYTANVSSAYLKKYGFNEMAELLLIEYYGILRDFNYLAMSIFNSITHKTKLKTIYNKMQKYLIKTIEIIEQYKNKVNINLNKAREDIIEEDLNIVAKNRIYANKQKKIINKEFDNSAFKAIKFKGNTKKQYKLLKKSSETFNKEFTERVVRINNVYLKNTKNMNDFLDFLRHRLVKIVDKNDKKIIKLLKIVDEDLMSEKKRFDLEYKSYLNTIEQFKISLEQGLNKEIRYLYDLNFQRDSDVNAKIELEEKETKHLPIKKLEILEILDKQKQDLFNAKQEELLQKLSKIEENKLAGKPVLAKEMEVIKNRLSDDYVSLYHEIQELENEFLEQYTLINEDYMENYRDYLNKQVANKISINSNDKLYQPFDWLSAYHKDLVNVLNLNKKEILQKSSDTRVSIKNEKQKSKEKQDRIINA